MTWRAFSRKPSVIRASPVWQPPIFRHASRSSGPAARWIAPSTPPPPMSEVFAAFTTASTSCSTMFPAMTTSRARSSTVAIAPLSFGDAIGAHEIAERFRNDDAAVLFLKLLEDREPRATDGEGGAVQRVREARLCLWLRAVADLCAAGLKITEPRAARDLAVRVLTREPHLEIVALGARKREV